MGSPLILATLAVIFAVVPLAFVGGMAGSYTRPMQIGASAAMCFSLVVSFVITPWAAYRLLKGTTSAAHAHVSHEPEDWTISGYRRIMRTLIEQPRNRALFLGGMTLLFAGAVSLLLTKTVRFKILPFDDKTEFKVVIDMPEGTTLEGTARVAQELAAHLRTVPEVVNFQTCIGAASPYDFNGLVRRYFLRRGPHVADISVNLLPKGARAVRSHEFLQHLRPALRRIADRSGARLTLAEPPPGPPMRQTLLVEVYGPDYGQQMDVGREVRTLFHETPGIVDIDWSVEAPQPVYRFVVDKEKAALHGISTDKLLRTLRLMLDGTEVGLFHDPHEKEAMPLFVRAARESRSSVADLRSVHLVSAQHALVPLAEMVRLETTTEPPLIYRKDLKPVVYVVGEGTGTEDSPLYAILKLNAALQKRATLADYPVYMIRQPFLTDRIALKWDGEWQLTYEFLRDVGFAFIAVIVLIYVLVVGWFQSFRVPLAILAPIPLSLIGILPAHWLLGAFFSGTSVIGFIAGAGVIVRNSIILVDFAALRRRQGASLVDAIIDAGAIRFRPMLLTAAAVVVGTSVILFDPIFQGLAISFMAGEVASTFLSRLAVPILYYLSERRQEHEQGARVSTRDFTSELAQADG